MDTRRSLRTFSDIIEPRRREISNFHWVSRKLNTTLAYKQPIRPTPQSHKQEVFHNQRIQDLIEKISVEKQLPRPVVEHNVLLILDEIGFNKQLKVIRWLGLVLAKICQRVYTGIHVNEESVNRLRSLMGNCPVIYAPSHKSYADFILMSYISFTYDLEIPAIAAGMDFHGMWGMGTVLRDTGAFFMRRAFNDDELYWETFKQYVHQIVTKGDLPIEFFIEGTRSRSCKSLCPKFGLLSMLLKPFFTAEVPDILVVPISISYDRVLEETLFAYELLGVPKPKESTSGFFKSLKIIKEKFGNIYVDFTEPISLKQYFGTQIARNHHILRPKHTHILSQEEKFMISSVAYDIVQTQQKHCVITLFNLISVILNNNNMLNIAPMSIEQLSEEVKWLQNIMEGFGALVSRKEANLLEALSVHCNFIRVDEELKVTLIADPIVIGKIDPTKLKAHALSDELMTRIVPEIMLQLYINPCLHYFINNCLIIAIMLTYADNKEIRKEELFQHFQFLRALFSNEFILQKKNDERVFEEALKNLTMLNGIEVVSGEYFVMTNNTKLQKMFSNLLNPFIVAYLAISYTLQKSNSSMEHSKILANSQSILERALMGKNVLLHPYCLSLDTLSICLQSFTNMGIVKRIKQKNVFVYEVSTNKLKPTYEILERIFEKCYGNFEEMKIVASKL